MFVFCLLSLEASKIFTLDNKQFVVSKRLTCWLAEKNKTGLQGPFDRSVHFVLCYSFVCVYETTQTDRQHHENLTHCTLRDETLKKDGNTHFMIYLGLDNI